MNPLDFVVTISKAFIKIGIIVPFIRKICKLTAFLLPQLMLVCLSANVVSQQLDQEVLFDFEIDKIEYYQDETQLTLIRIENRSDEVVTIKATIKEKYDVRSDIYVSVTSLETDKSYTLQYRGLRAQSWKLKPGEIVYYNEGYALEYHDRPAIMLAQLPAGEFAIEHEIHIESSHNTNYSLKRRREFTVKSIGDNLPPFTYRGETMKRYAEKRRMKLDTAVWNAEIRALLDSSEAAPYRNTIIDTYFCTSMDLNNGPLESINAIQKGIDIALRRPNDILPIELLAYGRRPKKYNHLYCERFAEIAATGDTRLHRYFQEFVCKQK